MYDFIERRRRTVTSRIDLWRYRATSRTRRLCRAWRYLTGRLTADDAQWITIDCRYRAGWHPLLTLTADDTLEQAREVFADHPQLPRLIADGCERVGCKWVSYDDQLSEARRWAIEVAEGYAAAEGITLVRIRETADAAASDTSPNSSPRSSVA